ncbi:MAG: type II toxin-antitoxin system RelE/ParE family toxin [Pyramidobacter sp.]|nr:type II toxin-antitoxin system RelE/ParE family toxin [Pyramidobacter sp.]MBQ9423762.1 type II toxin-antitoxin system RelE/ParE family toxin [Pyramidobacter sp.]
MTWTVRITKNAQKQLDKLDKNTAGLIVGWMRKNLEGCANPRLHGKALSANRAGQWRYRVGDYRLLAELNDGELIILMIRVAHRREAYR